MKNVTSMATKRMSIKCESDSALIMPIMYHVANMAILLAMLACYKFVNNLNSMTMRYTSLFVIYIDFRVFNKHHLCMCRDWSA